MGFSFNVDDYIDSFYGYNTNAEWKVSIIRKREERKKSLLQKISKTLELYTRYSRKDSQKVKPSHKEIERYFIELTDTEQIMRISEKNILRIWNSGRITSPLIKEVIQSLIDYFNDSCNAISETCSRIQKETRGLITYIEKDVDEKIIKKKLCKEIFETFGRCMECELPLSREIFRQSVKDLEVVLEFLNGDEKATKRSVEQYLVDVCGEKYGMVICQNCKHTLLARIPYCFNCYDGRYS